MTTGKSSELRLGKCKKKNVQQLHRENNLHFVKSLVNGRVLEFSEQSNIFLLYIIIMLAGHDASTFGVRVLFIKVMKS